MIIDLLSWISITLICLVWGNICMYWLAKKIIIIPSEIDFSLTCLTGLSIVGVISFYLSIFLPLDWKAHCSIVLPVVVYCLSSKNRNEIKGQVFSAFKKISVSGYCLFGCCVFMTLAMSSYKVTHPDTLAYHAQSILWFEKYRAVPGIVHLRVESGLQSVWFALQAVFNPAGDKVHFFVLGGCILCWYFLFIIKKIDTVLLKSNAFIKTGPDINWGWFMLLAYSLLSWTQVRLTAASASPDFIVSLFILAALYAFCQIIQRGGHNDFYRLLAAVFGCTAFLIKLSAVSILLLPIIAMVYLFRRRRFKIVFLIFLVTSIMVIPVLIRNVIASGYLLYPSSYPDFFNPDWKLNISALHKFQEYITVYARYPAAVVEAGKSIRLPLTAWIPRWWNHLAIPDRLLLCTIFIGSLLNLVFLRSFVRSLSSKSLILFFVVVTGCTLWFIKAPDPRFGSGFLVALVYLLYSPLEDKINIPLSRISAFAYQGMRWLLLLIIAGYAAYRVTVFFKPAEIIFPSGVEKTSYKEFTYDSIKMNMVKDSVDCGITPLPCVYDSCESFIPRGKVITDGFRERDNNKKETP